MKCTVHCVDAEKFALVEDCLELLLIVTRTKFILKNHASKFEEAALILLDREGSTPLWLVRPLLLITMKQLWLLVWRLHVVSPHGTQCEYTSCGFHSFNVCVKI